MKVYDYLKLHLKSAVPYALVVLAQLLLKLTVFGVVSFAQQGSLSPSIILTCLNAKDVKMLIASLQTILLVAIIAVVVLVLLFNTIGFISTMAMRIGEFFNERLRFVFELIVIYILFLYNFDLSDTGVIRSRDGCADVDWIVLFNTGPLFFRIVGWLVHALGLA